MRFKQALTEYRKEAYGISLASWSPDIECFVNAQAKAFNGEPNNIMGSIELSPIRSGKQGKIRLSSFKNHPIKMDKCQLLLDSGAFTDVLAGTRVSPEEALDRQIKFLDQLDSAPAQLFLVSYDRLIDEKHVNGRRFKIRWSQSDAELAVSQTVAAAKFLDSQRAFLPPCQIVQSCQGVSPQQYLDCTIKVLQYCRPGDVLGLGGWCILGREKRWMPTFWETITLIIPEIAKHKIDHVHIFGVTWFKSAQGVEPPLPKLLYLCDQYGIKLSTDGRAPIGNALWKSEDGHKKSGALCPYWRDNLAMTKAYLATLRDSEFYSPITTLFDLPLLKLLA